MLQEEMRMDFKEQIEVWNLYSRNRSGGTCKFDPLKNRSEKGS